jgi:predicted transcriptional regulator of viral defense system
MNPDWSCTVRNVVSTLERREALSAVEIPSEGDYRPFHRYVTPEATTFDVAAKLRPRGYFSHATSVFAHGLTEQIPQTLYINDEQSEKPAPAGTLTQASLDRAFKSRQRVSKFAFIYGRNRIVILNGKQTGSLGVITMDVGGSEHPVTDLERTLIDIAVRPVYGGGVYEIAAAYRAAVDRVKVGRIVEYLAELDYMYPYHQAIGFYLERAGASAKRTSPLRNLGLDLDFYLLHGLKAPVLDRSWRIHVPEGL